MVPLSCGWGSLCLWEKWHWGSVYWPNEAKVCARLRGGEFSELQFQLINQLAAAFGACAVAVVLQARDEFLEMGDSVLSARQCGLFGGTPRAFCDECFLACDIGCA